MDPGWLGLRQRPFVSGRGAAVFTGDDLAIEQAGRRLEVDGRDHGRVPARTENCRFAGGGRGDTQLVTEALQRFEGPYKSLQSPRKIGLADREGWLMR